MGRGAAERLLIAILVCALCAGTVMLMPILIHIGEFVSGRSACRFEPGGDECRGFLKTQEVEPCRQTMK